MKNTHAAVHSPPERRHSRSQLLSHQCFVHGQIRVETLFASKRKAQSMMIAYEGAAIVIFNILFSNAGYSNVVFRGLPPWRPWHRHVLSPGAVSGVKILAAPGKCPPTLQEAMRFILVVRKQIRVSLKRSVCSVKLHLITDAETCECLRVLLHLM